MENPPLRNPYEVAPEEPVYSFGRRFAVAVISAFSLLILIPGILALSEFLGEEAHSSVSETFEGRLREWETRFEEAKLFERWRAADQSRLVRWFAEGNSRVVIGEEGWLFYRPDIDAAIGKGPRYVEPPSVARAPSDEEWKLPLPIIEEFAGQLEERGISLVFVPVPTKAMIEGAGLGRDVDESTELRVPAEWTTVREEIESYGAQFVDLAPLFSRLAKQGDVFLRQDTHWSPKTMKEVAEFISEEVPAARDGNLALLKREVERDSAGDLVDMLQLDSRAESLFPPEKVQLEQILDSESGGPIANRTDSPVVLLGDSFVNVFEDPGLGFGLKAEDKIGAGISSHLAKQWKRPLHVIAINGGGATEVRKSFASLPDEEVRKKETVIWLFSARDLLLAEIPGRRAGISWQPVEFSTRTSQNVPAIEKIILTGTLSARSQAGDPKVTPYASALYSGIFTELEVQSGNYQASEAWVFLWAFRERKRLPSGALQAGKRYRLELQPLPDSGPEASATQIDDFFRVDLERLFATSFEELK